MDGLVDVGFFGILVIWRNGGLMIFGIKIMRIEFMGTILIMYIIMKIMVNKNI